MRDLDLELRLQKLLKHLCTQIRGVAIHQDCAEGLLQGAENLKLLVDLATYKERVVISRAVPLDEAFKALEVDFKTRVIHPKVLP